MVMRPVRPPSKALPTCAPLNFPIHLPVSRESAGFVLEFTTVVKKNYEKQPTKGYRGDFVTPLKLI